MLPTFREDGDVVIIQKLDHSKTLLGRLFFNNEDDKQATTIDMPKQTPRWHRHVYKKGDAVIACCKDDVNKTVCKRIAGIEGDLMSFRGNGKKVCFLDTCWERKTDSGVCFFVSGICLLYLLPSRLLYPSIHFRSLTCVSLTVAVAVAVAVSSSMTVSACLSVCFSVYLHVCTGIMPRMVRVPQGTYRTSSPLTPIVHYMRCLSVGLCVLSCVMYSFVSFVLVLCSSFLFAGYLESMPYVI